MSSKTNNQLKRSFRTEGFLTLPGIVVVAVVTQVLFAGTIILSLLKWNIVRPDQGIRFIGINNYLKILKDPEVYIILLNTFYIAFMSLALSFCIGFAIALLLNREFKGVNILRGLILIPFFITDVVAGIIFKTLILHPSFGIAGFLASKIGIEPIDFMGQHAQLSIIFLIVWQWTPFFVLILLAGLQSIDHQLLESAQLEGANKLVVLFQISIPSMLHHIRVAVLLGIIFILKVFGLIYVSTSGGPGIETTTLPYIVYKTNQFKWEVGEAASLSILTVVITIIILSSIFKYFQKKLA